MRDFDRMGDEYTPEREAKRRDFDCPPYLPPSAPPADASVLELAAHLNAAANYYRAVVDGRGDYGQTLGAANRLARAADALTAKIADGET